MVKALSRLGAASLCALSLVLGEPAEAQSSGEWLFKTALELQTLVFRPACQGDTPIEDIYILGVRDPGDILTESEETRIVAEMSDFFSARMPFTVTKADNFGAIAESYTGNAQADIDELSRAMRAASRAGLTVVIEPFARQGTEVEAEVRAWTRAGADVSCAPSFRTRIPTGTEDPACARNYKMAQEDGSVSALKFFIAYSGHCPEVRSASQRMRALEEEAARTAALAACRQDFQSAVSIGTEAALGDFTARNPTCPEVTAAQVMRAEAAKTAICAQAYGNAELESTELGYEAFLRAHPGCAQASVARLALKALRSQRPQATTPQAPAPQQSVVTPPRASTNFPRPSWCSKASTLTENAICGNAQVAALDADLNRAYSAYRSRLSQSGRRQLTRDQRAWLAYRDSCGANAGCLAQAYQSRIAQLR